MKARDIVITVFALFTCLLLVSCTGGAKKSDISEEGKALLTAALTVNAFDKITGGKAIRFDGGGQTEPLPKRPAEEVKKAYEEAGVRPPLPPRPDGAAVALPPRSEDLAALTTECEPIEGSLVPGITLEGCVIVDIDETTLDLGDMVFDIERMTATDVTTPSGSVVTGSITTKMTMDVAAGHIDVLYARTLDDGLNIRQPGVVDCEPNIFTCGIVTYDISGGGDIGESGLTLEVTGDAYIRAHESETVEYCNLKITMAGAECI